MDKNDLMEKFLGVLKRELTVTNSPSTVPIPFLERHINRGSFNMETEPLPRIFIWDERETVEQRNRLRDRRLDTTLAILFNPNDYRDTYDNDSDCRDAIQKEVQLVLSSCREIPVIEVANETFYIIGDPSFMSVEITVVLKYVTEY